MKLYQLSPILFILFASNLFAHSTSGDSGFFTGMGHPVLGFDHLLAMISVGLLSTIIGGRAIWFVPLTFVFVMILGGLAGILALPLPGVEWGIGVSVVILGYAILAANRFPVLLTFLFVAFFAAFHGYAHGLEMPEIARPLQYFSGFVTGTAIIHIAGVLIGLVAKQWPEGEQALKYSGATIAGIGIHILMSGV